MVDHVVGHLLDGDMGPERARPRTHDGLHRPVAAAGQLVLAEQAEHHPFVVDDDARVPVGGLDPIPDLGQALVEAARGDVAPGDVTRSRLLGVRSLRRQSGGQPVELPGRVVVDLLEAKALEPPRGPRAEVSGRVPAVDDDRTVPVEPAVGVLDVA